jgi:hypothetical protein
MTDSVPSLSDIKTILGKYSIDSISNWLKRCELPSSASSRDEIAQKVHGLIEKKALTLEGLIAAMIGIEEASSKRTFLFRVPHTADDLKQIDKQLADLKVTLTKERVPAANPNTTPKVVYAINDPDELRIKWTELHTKVEAVRKTRTWKETKVPKIVVLIVNKSTGLVQLRYDHPEDEHEHFEEGEPADDAYYSYFKAQAENLTGLALEAVELRNGLENVLKASPRIVKTSYTVDESDDGGLTKRTQKQRNKDVRDLAEWQYVLDSKTVRTFEEAPVKWIKEMSGGELNREVFSYIDAANGMVRFDAHCYEGEVEYVLGRLV